MHLLLLTACGGSSGGGEDSTSPPSQSPTNPPPSTPPTTATWSDPTAISSQSGGAGDVQVVIDNAGNALSVWLQLDSGVYSKSLWASRHVAGSGWSSPALIEDGDANIRDFKLVMRPETGRAAVLWTQFTTVTQTSGNHDVWARTFDPTSGWESVARVESNPGEVTAPSAGIDANGVTFAVWSQAQNSRYHVWVSRNTPGGGWNSPVQIEAHDVLGDNDVDARIAVLSSGDALAVWKRSTGTSTSLWTNTYHSVGGWDSERELVADQGVYFSLDAQPSLAADASGGALLVWGQWQLMNGQHQSTVVAKRYAAGWQAANTEIATPVASTTISNPFIAVNATGAAAVLWQRADLSLQAGIAPAGGTWGAPVALRPIGSRDLRGTPAVALDSSGKAFAAWAASVSTVGDPDVSIVRYVPGEGWGTAQTLHTSTVDASASSAVLAMNERGDAVVAYIETTSATGSRIVVRNYSVP